MKTLKTIFATTLLVALTINSNAQWNPAANGIKLTPATANAGIGGDPKSNAKLRLYNSASPADTIFGLHTVMANTSSDVSKPVYGIFSTNTNAAKSAPVYGAYFKNTQSYSGPMQGNPVSSVTYGAYLDNSNSSNVGLSYGVYTNNTVNSQVAGQAYGFYSNNVCNSDNTGVLYGLHSINTIKSGGSGAALGAFLRNTRRAASSNNSSGDLYGVQVINVDSSYISTGSVYGIHLSNTSTSGGNSGNMYGVYSANAKNNSGNGALYGGYFSATRSTTSGSVYGLYSTVAGGSTNNRWAGYFTGGNVAVMEGNAGIGTATPSAKLHIVSDANTDAAILATSSENNRLIVRSGTTQPAFSTTFSLLHDFGGNRNNGFIHFLRGGSNTGGFLQFGTNGQVRMTIDTDGKVGIGKTDPYYDFDVAGIIRAREVIVNLNNGADFVFDESYALKPLNEVHNFIRTNRRLPEIPSAADMVNNGLDIGEFQIKLLQKIEELTLYVIDQDNRIKQQQEEINRLKNR